MRRVRMLSGVLLLLCGPVAMTGTAVLAQSPDACRGEDFGAFDFWIGSWDVFVAASGNHAGTNRISKIEGDCALLEQWRSDNGSTGTSINYHDPAADRWRQIWVSEVGYNIDIAGGIVDGAMVLEGVINYYEPEATWPFRGTWTAQTDGSVHQYFQQYDPEAGVWNDWFEGIYRRAAED